MPLTIQDFRQIAESTSLGTRDIVVNGTGDDATVSLGKIGRMSVSTVSKNNNVSTMAAFRAALKNQFGVLGEHAFDSVLGTRTQLGKSLRKADVEKTFSQLESVKRMHLKNEVARLVETDPRVLSRSPELANILTRDLTDGQIRWLITDRVTTLEHIKSLASMYVDAKVKVFDRLNPGARNDVALNANDEMRPAVADTDPMGLLTLDDVSFKSNEASVEDRVKSGEVGVAMRVNLKTSNPLLFEKLKTNGVEPGFIVHKDWSPSDTRALMVDALTAGIAMGANGSAATILQQGLAAGVGHFASMAFTAESIMMRDLGRPDTDLGRAFAAKFPELNVNELFPADIAAASPNRAETLKKVKEELFAQIRDAVMTERNNAQLPLCKKFTERHIVKLDYNEGDRSIIYRNRAGSLGKMRLPERCSIKGGAFKGFFFRKFRLTTSDKASAGAVAEAFANDLTRMAGIPAQELSIVRGSYSDGHTKLMLQAKFADGYKDLEDGFIRDGRIVNQNDGQPLESLGRYKAMFLLLADRDAIGSHGQNKGFRDGRFFAIDPGHSLEGNGQYLKINDDLSFEDTAVNILEKRFLNFSVFDDSTRFEKFQGILSLRELNRSNRITDLYNQYCAKFRNLPESDRKLSEMVLKRLEGMKSELDEQMAKILNVFDSQLKLYDALTNDPQGGPDVGRDAIETLSNLEKATSPTTKMSAKGLVELRHLEVIPKTRIAWSGKCENGEVTYTSSKPLSMEARAQLQQLLGDDMLNVLTVDENTGLAKIVLTPDNRNAVFEALSEDNIIRMKAQA